MENLQKKISERQKLVKASTYFLYEYKHFRQGEIDKIY